MSLNPTTNREMEYFGANETQTLVTNSLGTGVVGISRLRSCQSATELCEATCEDAILVAYQHKPLQADLFLDDRHVVVKGFHVGTITVYDYRLPWACSRDTGFEATNFHVPRALLGCLSTGARSPGDVIVKPGICLDDPVIRGLVVALDSMFQHPARLNTLFLDHIGWALAAHCAANFLEDVRARPLADGGLALWQERLAKDMIAAQLDGKIRLADLAAACGLSVSHFARAFRRSTSVPPHRWLIYRRIERAQHLLLISNAAIAEIALDCGFNDQSHFTTVFRKVVGASPAGWRRNRRN